MDKWDIFPPKRANNRAWLEDYDLRRSLIAELVPETQHHLVVEPDP